MGRFLLFSWLLVVSITAIGAENPPFVIELAARVDAQQRTASGQTAATGETKATSAMLTAKSKATLHVRWSIENQDETRTFADVTIHCVLEKEGRIGQGETAQPSGMVYESALLMDFAPRAMSTAEFAIEVPEPGRYLLRVETIGVAKQGDHEYFAVLDLKAI